MEKQRLIADVKSWTKTLYAHSGDEVTVIADHGNVLIVEDIKGKRFPCRRDAVFLYDILNAEKPVADLEPGFKKVPVSKKRATKPAPSIIQQTMF